MLHFAPLKHFSLFINTVFKAVRGQRKNLFPRWKEYIACKCYCLSYMIYSAIALIPSLISYNSTIQIIKFPRMYKPLKFWIEDVLNILLSIT